MSLGGPGSLCSQLSEAVGAEVDTSHRLGVQFGGGGDDIPSLDDFLCGQAEPSFVSKCYLAAPVP